MPVQEVDLDELRANLLAIAVVAETMQPEQISLWLRPFERNDHVRAGQ